MLRDPVDHDKEGFGKFTRDSLTDSAIHSKRNRRLIKC